MRRGALGLEQRLVDGLNVTETMHLKAADFEEGHLCEMRASVRSNAGCSARRLVRGRLLVSGFAAGEDERSGHALQVPLEGAADGFVEVVDVEDEAAVGCGEGAEVAHMRVAAELRFDAGIGQDGQVGGHHRRGAAKVAEGRLGHQAGA